MILFLSLRELKNDISDQFFQQKKVHKKLIIIRDCSLFMRWKGVVKKRRRHVKKVFKHWGGDNYFTTNFLGRNVFFENCQNCTIYHNLKLYQQKLSLAFFFFLIFNFYKLNFWWSSDTSCWMNISVRNTFFKNISESELKIVKLNSKSLNSMSVWTPPKKTTTICAN